MRDNPDARPILLVAGTRPEVIKLAPVYFHACERFGREAVQWISTGQHEKLEAETLASFGIECTHRLNAGDCGGQLMVMHDLIVRHLGELMGAVAPPMVVVQGDTLSAFSASFAAFHAGVPIAHIEAGLRTYDNRDPYPEESYRRMIDALATIHFPPTQVAAAHLRSEGVADSGIYVTGNTAVDALSLIDAVAARTASTAALPPFPQGKRLLFVTLHRRESWGEPMREMCLAVRDIAERFSDVQIVFPLHVNPVVRGLVRPLLSGHPRIMLVPPLDFAACHKLISQSDLILTDSGGIQEEAPSYGVPVIVLRRKTERPEALDAGLSSLTGTCRSRVVDEASRFLVQPPRPHQRCENCNPFGDGKAAERIVRALVRYMRGEYPLLTKSEQFYRESP